MKRLRKLQVREVSLVRSPANKKKFIVYKSQDKGGRMPDEPTIEDAVRNANPDKLALISKAVKARAAISKAVGNPVDEAVDPADAQLAAESAGLSPQAQTQLKAIGRIIASNTEGITMSDILAVCDAAGVDCSAGAEGMSDDGDAEDDTDVDPEIELSEATTKADDDDGEEEDEDMDVEKDAQVGAVPFGASANMAPDMKADKPKGVSADDHSDAMDKAKKAYMAHMAGKKDKAEADAEDEDAEDKKRTPPVPGEKKGKPTMKSVKEDDTLVEIQKAQKLLDDTNKILVQKNAQLEAEVKAERDYRVTKSIERECEQNFPNLGIETAKVALVLKSMKDQGDMVAHDNYVAVLKAADAQVALANKAGGSIYGTVGRVVSPTELSGAEAKLEALVDSHVAKSSTGKSRPEIYSMVLDTPEGRDLYNQSVRERN